MITKDSELTTVEDLEVRFQSICRQLDKLDSVFNPRNFDKHQAKYAKLVHRRDCIYDRLSVLKRGKV